MTDRFEEEVETALAQPGLSYAMAEKIKRYPAWARAKVTTQAHQTAQNWREEAARRIDEVVPVLDTARDGLGEIERALDDNTMTALEAIEALDAIRGRMTTAERRYNAACSTDAHADAVHTDPVGYMENIYSTYPALREKQITLNDYLAHVSGRGSSSALGFRGQI